MAYGFDIDVGGDVLIQMKKIETEIATLTAKIGSSTEEIKKDFKETSRELQEFGRTIAEVFAIEKIREFGMELLHLTAEFEGFANVIKYASKNGYDGVENLNYIREAVDRLHLPIKESTQAFAEMEAGFYGTGIEGDRLRKVFEGVATASSVLHLNPFQFSNVTFAMKEIGELGTLQARQLRMLAFSLPGAVNIAAKSMGMSTGQLHEAMKKGEINSSVFLPKFAAAMQSHFAPGLGNAGNSLISQMNDTQTAFTKLKLELGENLHPVFTKIMKDIRETFNSDLVRSFVANIVPIVQVVATIAKYWAIYTVGVKAATYAMEAYKGVTAAVTAIQALLGFEVKMTAAAMASLETTAMVTGIGALAIGIGYLVSKLMDANKELNDFATQATNIAELSEQFKNLRGGYKSIETAMKGNLDKDEKSEVYADVLAAIKKTQGQLDKSLNPQIGDVNARLAEARKNDRNSVTGDLTGGISDPKMVKTWELLQDLNFQQRDLNRQLINLNKYKNNLEAQGIKVPTYKGTNGVTEGSLNTSHLAGASGGLGEAKIIQIHFHDAFQKNVITQGAGWDKASRQAIEAMLRMLNNIGSSQSTTQ